MRIVTLALAGALVAAAVATPAGAATKRLTITRTYTANAPVPDTTTGAASRYHTCPQTVPDSYDVADFRAPRKGTLDVRITGITGDWDLLIVDAEGAQVATGATFDMPASNGPQKGTESALAMLPRAGAYRIIACNFAGGPTATVRYVFTSA